MKNNTVRIHRNGGKNRRSKQVQSKRCKTTAAKLPRQDDALQQMVIFKPGVSFSAPPECGVATQLNISPKRFRALKTRAREIAVPLKDFIRGALDYAADKRPAAQSSAPPAAPALSVLELRNCADAVNTATAQNNAFLELLSSHLDWRENRSGIVLTHEQTEQFNFGVEMISARLRDELANASNAMINAAYKTREVAS